MTPRILVVEDEEAIAEAIEYNLVSEGFEVDLAADGEAAAQANHDDYDVIVLDLALPKISGHEVCRRIRARSIVPILMLTARTSELDRVMGLEVGADDYVAKPFSSPELIGRIRAMIRRTRMERSSSGAVRTVGEVQIDLVSQTVRVEGRLVELTQSEFRLLTLLASKPERAFSRREIVEHLWRSTHVGTRRTCDVHVKNLRRKIEHDPAHPVRVVTVRGVGYMLRTL